MHVWPNRMGWMAVILAGLVAAGCGAAVKTSTGGTSTSSASTTKTSSTATAATGCKTGSAGTSNTVTTPQEPDSGVNTPTGSCWAQIAGTPVTLAVLHSFPSNFSAQFKTAWSSSGVYMLVVVKKWPLYNANATGWYKNDAVEFYISGSNDRSGSYKTTPGTAQIGVTNLDQLEHGTNGASFTGAKQSVTVISKVGYDAELFVPWSNLTVTGAAGKKLGFDVAVDVANATGTNRTAQVAWTGTSNNYNTDSGFGTMVLG